MSDSLDLLIHRHLDGTLSEAEATALQERLRGDVDARRRLAEMAFEHAQLKGLLEPAKNKAKPTPAAWHWVAAALILVAVAVALAVGTPKRATPEVTPAVEEAKQTPRREGFQGFRGRVHARVLERKDKARLQLKVGEVLAVRDASEAAAPGSLVGEAIAIPLPRLKDGDSSSLERDHGLFLAKLLAGQEVVLELRHVEASDFAIVSLTEEQAEWARRDDRKKVPKEGVKDPPREGAPRETPKKTDREDR